MWAGMMKHTWQRPFCPDGFAKVLQTTVDELAGAG
jgi:hypothetical protein